MNNEVCPPGTIGLLESLGYEVRGDRWWTTGDFERPIKVDRLGHLLDFAELMSVEDIARRCREAENMHAIGYIPGVGLVR